MAKPSVLYYFTLVMTGMYFITGLILMFAPVMENLLPGWKHTVLGLMLIAYGLMRLKRLKGIRKSMEDGV